MKLIINADDFGLTAGVCRSIRELLEIGAITDTTAMIAADGVIENGIYAGGRELEGHLGLHLMLTGGRPVSAPNEIPSLVGAQGQFRKKEDVRPDAGEVRLEWSRQVEEFEAAYGFMPTHLDSHHGVHRMDGISEVYWELASKWNIPVRSADSAWNERMKTASIVGPDWVDSNWTGGNLGLAALQSSILDGFALGEIGEIVVHPGYSDEALCKVSSWTEVREKDMADLKALCVSGWLREQGIQLVSYKSL
jgi:chitin disaccharide deacetylase